MPGEPVNWFSDNTNDYTPITQIKIAHGGLFAVNGEAPGKTCSGTEATTNMMGMKTKPIIWQYGNFTMESVSEGAGTNFKEGVTKFEEGIDINPTIFEVPKDVDIEDKNNLYKNDN